MVRVPGVILAMLSRWRCPRLVVRVDFNGEMGLPCFAMLLTMIGSVSPCAI